MPPIGEGEGSVRVGDELDSVNLPRFERFRVRNRPGGGVTLEWRTTGACQVEIEGRSRRPHGRIRISRARNGLILLTAYGSPIAPPAIRHVYLPERSRSLAASSFPLRLSTGMAGPRVDGQVLGHLPLCHVLSWPSAWPRIPIYRSRPRRFLFTFGRLRKRESP